MDSCDLCLRYMLLCEDTEVLKGNKVASRKATTATTCLRLPTFSFEVGEARRDQGRRRKDREKEREGKRGGKRRRRERRRGQGRGRKHGRLRFLFSFNYS